MRPIAAIGALVIRNKRILLVKRRNPPNQGLWTIPGGKIKFGESMQQAAEREIYEETGIIIKARNPIFTFDLIDQSNCIHYVIVDLIADYVSGEIKAADDAIAAQWFHINELVRADIETESKKLVSQYWDGEG